VILSKLLVEQIFPFLQRTNRKFYHKTFLKHTYLHKIAKLAKNQWNWIEILSASLQSSTPYYPLSYSHFLFSMQMWCWKT